MNAPIAVAPTLRADPLADDAIAAILHGHEGSQWEAIAIVNRLLGEWQSNAIIAGWRAPKAPPRQSRPRWKPTLPQARGCPNGPMPPALRARRSCSLT